MWRRWTPTVLVAVTVLVSVLGSSSPASATTTNYAASSGGGSVSSSDFTNSSNTIDGNDTTYGYTTTTAGFCNTYGNAFAPYNRVALSGGTGLHIQEVHVKLHFPCVGSGGTNASAVEIACGTGGTAWVKGFLMTSTDFDGNLDLSTGGTGYAGGCVTSGTSVMSVRYWSGGDGTQIRIYEFEAYDSAQPDTVGIETYCYNMNVQHPFFAWDVFCNFRQDNLFHGTVDISYDGSSPKFYLESCAKFGLTSCDTTDYTSTLSLSPTGGFGGSTGASLLWLRQKCSLGGCASDHVTISVTDTDNNQVASYTFNRSDSGAVQDLTVRPTLIMFRGCYNSSTNQCHGVDPLYANGATGTASLRWEVTPGTDYSVAIGKFSRMKDDGTPNLTATGSYTATPLDAGTEYSTAVTAASSGVWGIIASNGAGSSWMSVDIDVADTAATSTGTEYPSGDPNSYGAGPCDVQHLDNCFRQLFTFGEDSLMDAVSGGLDDLRELALSRDPFALVLRAYEGVSSQVTRALDATDDEDDCAGLGLQLPELPTISFTAYGKSYENETWPTGVTRPTFYVLKCADLEPIFGTDEWQAIRGALSPAMLLANAVWWLKRLQPKPSVNG